MRRHLHLGLALFAPAALLCGCRAGSWEFSPLKSMVDATWESHLQKNETPAETEERRWREFREE